MASQLHFLCVVLMARRLSGSPIWTVLTAGAVPGQPGVIFPGAQCWPSSKLQALHLPAPAQAAPHALLVPQHVRKPRVVMPSEADNLSQRRKEISRDQRLHFYFRNPGCCAAA